MDAVPDAVLQDRLSAALAAGRIVPHFQPVVALADNEIVGFEVLARWHDEVLGHVPPGVFIPAIERGGRLDACLESVMGRAMTAAGSWPAPLFLAFNISPTQLRDPALPSRIARVAAATGFAPARIVLEITETATIEDGGPIGATLFELIAMGCDVVADDFGTGYSSLTWLLNLPVSKIKIDRVFVASMLERKQSRKIVNAVIGLGQSLGLAVVAEGVERPEQAEFLQRIGCGFAQGFLFGHAVPAEAVPGVLAAQRQPQPPPARPRMSLEQRAYQISSLYQGDDVALGFLDMDGMLVDASDSFVRRLGQRREGAIGRRIEDLATQGAGFAHHLATHRQTGASHGASEVAHGAGRTDVLIVQQVRDEVGEPLGLSALAIDVTESKEASRKLLREQERFRFIVEHCPHAFWGMSAEGKLEFVTSYWEALSGMTIEMIHNGAVWDFLDPEHRDDVLSYWKHCLATGQVYDIDYRHRLADGKLHWVRCWCAPHRDAAEPITFWYGTLTLLTPPRPPGPAQA